MKYVFISWFFITNIILSSCVTTVTNSDGTVINSTVDKKKLAEIYTKLAIEYQNKGSLPIALGRVNLAIDNNHDYAQAYMVRATIYQELKKVDLARSDFDTALKLDKNSSNINTNYAIFLCDQGDYIYADKLFADALNNPLYETPELGYLARGNCYYKQKKLSLANADYLQALSYKNIPSDVYITIAELQFEEKNYTLASFYMKQYQGKDTPLSLLLKIKIATSLLPSLNSNDIVKYKNTIKLLGNSLLKEYPNSYEAQDYLTTYSKYGLQTSLP